MQDSLKMKYASNTKPRQHNYSPIMNQYELNSKMKGLQSTLVPSKRDSVGYIEKLTQDNGRSVN